MSLAIKYTKYGLYLLLSVSLLSVKVLINEENIEKCFLTEYVFKNHTFHAEKQIISLYYDINNSKNINTFEASQRFA